MRFRPSVADRFARGGRSCHLIGPLALREPESIDRALAHVASFGPLNRIGLHPGPSRSWVFDPDSPAAWSVRRDADSFDAEHVDAELARMMAAPPVEPISIRLKGDYALVDIDHGLGDAAFMWAVSTLVAGDAARAVAEWPRANAAHPITTALRHAARNDPRQLAAGFTGLIRRRLNASDEGKAVRRTPLKASATAVLITSDAGYIDALRHHPAGAAPASTFSKIVAATARSLRRHGINPWPTAGAVVGLRRYLPENASTLANFMSWVDMPFDIGVEPADIHRALQDAVGSYVPLANFAVATCLGSMRRHIAAWSVFDVAVCDRARLVFSDLRRVPAISRYSWAATSSPPICTVALALGLKDQISIAITELPNGAIQCCATFYDSAFDPAAVRSALIDALSTAQ
jgi:hypothetical protein